MSACVRVIARKADDLTSLCIISVVTRVVCPKKSPNRFAAAELREHPRNSQCSGTARLGEANKYGLRIIRLLDAREDF